jgi:hypothetical protein
LFFADANFTRGVCHRLRRYSYSFPVKINRKAKALTGNWISTGDCAGGDAMEMNGAFSGG